MANCSGCGGLMKFDILTQQLKCTSCDQFTDPYREDAVNNAEDNTYETTIFTCPQCGGELYSTDHDLSGNCSFCGSPVVFDSKLVKEKRPDYIIPFGITKDECKEAYFEALKKNPFAPKELKDPDFVDGFRGIYVPYWIYDVNQDGNLDITAKRSETKGSYTYEYTDRITGKMDSHFSHIMHDASSVLQDDISEKVEPFETVKNPDILRRTPELQKFSTSFFSGFYAEPADVSDDTYSAYSENIANERSSGYINSHPEVKKYNLKVNTDQLGTTVRKSGLAMMPVWFLSYRKRDRVAYAAVNGQTGRVISDTPIDLKLFGLHFLIAAAIIFVILNFSASLPVSVTLISVIMAEIVTRYCHDDIKALKGRNEDARKGRLRQVFGSSAWTFGIFVTILIVMVIFKLICLFDNDVVVLVDSHIFAFYSAAFNIAHIVRMILLYKDLGNVKEDKPLSYYLCPMFNLAAGVFGNAVLFLSPVEDYKYYAAGIFAGAVELTAFFMIIKNYNRVATRPLPQFSIHKGGDDRA